MTRRNWVLAAVLLLIAATSGYVAASRLPRPAAASPDYAATATIKDLMDAIVDPSADDVWNAVKTTVGPGGVDETAPVTEEEWTSVRRGALRLAEATNLLMVPGRHMARLGEKSETPGVELEPAEMEALVNGDRPAWNQHARDLRDVSLEVLKATDSRDAAKLFEVGGRLDAACESCHKQYWYPNEKIPDFPNDVGTAARPTAGE